MTELSFLLGDNDIFTHKCRTSFQYYYQPRVYFTKSCHKTHGVLADFSPYQEPKGEMI